MHGYHGIILPSICWGSPEGLAAGAPDPVYNLPAKPFIMEIIQSLKDLRKVLLILVFLMVFFIVLSPPQDADMWWHLAAGKKMVEQGKMLTTDTFSYTHHGEPWTNAFWLSDIILFLAYWLGGYMGITLLVATLAVITMGILHRHSREGVFPIKLFIILLGTLAIAPVWTPRPQIFSFLLLAILDYGLNGSEAFLLKRPWLLIPLFVLWANVHGGFIWGFLLLFAFISGNWLDRLLTRKESLTSRALNRLAIWTCIAALAILINPNGVGLWKLPFYTVDVSIQSITEWRSPDFHRLDMHPMLWLLFLVIIGTGMSKNLFSWSNLLKVIGFSYMAFISQRSIGPFVIITIPIVIHLLTSAWYEWQPIISKFHKATPSGSISTVFAVSLNIFILGIVGGMTILRAHSVSTDQQVHLNYPVKAVEAIRARNPKANMFNSYNWGGYLQWQLPEYLVFIDGRADLYGEQTINDWWIVVNGTDQGLKLLDALQVNFVILEPGWPILEELEQSGWQTIYQDPTAVVMER